MKEAGFSETQAAQLIATQGKAEKRDQLQIITSYTHPKIIFNFTHWITINIKITRWGKFQSKHNYKYG